MISSFSKLKCSDSSSESKLSQYLSLDFFLNVSDLFKEEATIVISSSTPGDQFLVLMNLLWPPSTQAENQVIFIDLACTCINLHKLISLPGPCRVQVGLFL